MLSLRAEFLKIGFDLTDQQEEQFKTYFTMLVETNKVMNLTAITEWDDVVMQHFCDSALPCKSVKTLQKALESNDASHPVRLLDVGTGAGFPGIPLKILYPDVEMVLLDSLQKRVKFLNNVIDACHLEKISAVHARAEDGARDANLREGFDLVVSRAVADLPILAEWCLPFVKVGGSFTAYKSRNIEDEESRSIKAIKTLGGAKPFVDFVPLPDTEITRSFVTIRKTKPTPKAYPRKPGMAKKNPL